ncbi:aspartyl-phosphate phosphatase Spo0E family protein [Niallia endozanthoxylica]|uniref:Aspartyl-phosphate phosphatase Spo0E family protein n=1 Tax=Niallia endozanthoxylica TaxID=2036016 RepID=A0A5J5I2Q9_9BACI|nr:aspartyl-phosphate phosphatase Spo0E family protein [Niallia endozanthoxylica]KAA9029951.1 aspartyl-phosphate phosphatase Spo0E family protein [Niallia endozanthoxylica]
MFFRFNYDEKNDLLNIIATVREEMIRTGMKEGLTSTNTITLSQRLDEYIAKYQAILIRELA